MQSPFINKTTFYSSKAQMIRKENAVYIFFSFKMKQTNFKNTSTQKKKEKKRHYKCPPTLLIQGRQNIKQY